MLAVRKPFVHRTAALRHQRRHAEFGQHVRGRFHLGGAAHGAPAGAAGNPAERGCIDNGQFGGDVLAKPLLLTRGPGGVEGLDDRGRHALVEHAAQQLPGGGQSGRAVEDPDVGAERPQQVRVTRSARPAGEHRDMQAVSGHRGHDGDIGKRDAGFPRDLGQLPLDPR